MLVLFCVIFVVVVVVVLVVVVVVVVDFSDFMVVVVVVYRRCRDSLREDGLRACVCAFTYSLCIVFCDYFLFFE